MLVSVQKSVSMIKNNVNNNRITKSGNPTNNLDAVTKLYVDFITDSVTTHPAVLRKELEHTFATPCL